MKLLPRILLALVLCVSVLPVASAGEDGDQTYCLPLDTKVGVGVTQLSYQGQNFRINTTARVDVRFETLSPNLIRIRFVSAGASGKISVYWLNFEKFIYDGLVPLPEPWEADLQTEGGFVDR
jgi:hypothetical protein